MKIKKGDKIYTVLRHCSRSGMQREIGLFVIRKNKLVNITYIASKILGNKIGKHQGIIIKGCGMDMGFSIVYNLSISLFCPKKYNHDAAYSLHHEWI